MLDTFLNEDGKLQIPTYIKNIRFDIGLSNNAPNSAIWLNKDTETFVIGIEANKYACEHIMRHGGVAHESQDKFSFPHPNFMLLNFAIDNVDDTTTKPFYHMNGDVGVSSLLKPTNTLSDSIRELSDITVISLSQIFEKIDWNRFEYVEMVKIDTQGKDLDIIKSLGNYLDKIVYLNCEINTFDHYENNPKPIEFDNYLFEKGFEAVLDNSFVNNEVVDKTYINKKYIHLKDKINNFVL